MQTNDGALLFKISADQSDIKEKIEAIKKQFESLTKKTQEEGEKQAQVWQNLIKGATAYFTFQGASAFIKQVIAVRSQFQQLEIAFGTMLKSKEKANALMAQMTDLAAKTPFGLQEVSEGAKRLLAFQVPAEEVTETLRRMGDVAAGLGVPMGQLIHVYGQVKAQGKLMTNDLYQFMNAGIPIIAELSKVVGKSETEIKDMVSAGKIGFAEVQAVIKGMTDEGGLFYNLMAEQSKTLSGQLSNLEDNFDNMLNEIGKATEGIASGAISSVAFLVENYQTLGKVIAGLIATYGAYRTAVLVNIALTKGWAVAAKEDAIAKGIQTIATNAATAATKALNAAMKANPYVLVATAVVGLGAAIWALKDNTTAAEKAQQDYNNQKQQAIDWEQQHKQKIDELIESATNQALADTERQKALIALQNEYPNIFAKYDIESLKLADILKLKQEIAQYDANEKRLNRANEYGKYQDFEKALNKAKTGKRTYDANKLKNSILDEEMTRVFGKSWIHNIDEVEKYIREKQKITKNDYKGDRVAAWSMDVKNLSEEEIKKELEHRQKLIADLQKQKKAGNKWASHGVNFGGDWFAFNEEELQAQSKTLQAQLDKLHEQTYEYKDLTKKYTQAVKDAEKALDTIKNGGKGKHTEEEFAKIIKEAEDNLKNAKKTLEDHKTSLSKSKGTKAAKSKTELPTFDYEKDKRDKERLEKDRMFEEDEAKIKAMKDGGEKRNALLVLEYEKRAETIKRKGEDELQAFIETEKQKAEAEGKWKKGQEFNTDTPAIQEEKARIAKNQEVLNQDNLDEYTRQQEAMYKELLEKYQTYTDQRKAIEEKYNADIAALQAKLGADAPQVKKAQDEKARELKKLDILYKKEGAAIAKLFENMRKKTVKEIRETIADAEKEIDQLASMLDMGDKDNVDYIQNLKQQLEQARDTADRSDTVFGRLGKNIQALFKFKPNTIEWKDALQGVISDAQSITSEFGQLGAEFEKIGKSSGNSSLESFGRTLQNTANLISKTMQYAQIGGSTGNGWGALIGAVVGFAVGGIEKAANERMAHEKKLAEVAKSKIAQQTEYNRLLFEEKMLHKENTSIFGTKEIANAYTALSDYVDKYNEFQKSRGNLSGLSIANGSYTKGAWFWKKQGTIWDGLLEVYPKLIDQAGNFNLELAESIVKNREFYGTGKEALQDAIDTYKQMQEAEKQFDEFLKNTFGQLGNGIIDSVVNSLKTGENAFDAFAKSVGNIVENLGKKIAYELFLADYLKDFQNKVKERVKAISKEDTLSQSEKSKKTAEYLRDTTSQLAEEMKWRLEATKNYIKQFADAVPNEYNPLNEQRKAVEKGYMRMSQDTGDDLLGQQRLLTELQKQTKDGILQAIEYYKGFTNSFETLKNNLAQQLQHLAGIETNTFQLHEMKKDIANMKAGISEITTKGIKIRS
ncbi:tape measure protein [Capnocytophaga sp. CM59]|uniref:tape measure protein n=1 Tax=Capnocytophaga sp. CM59 TaxID=936370 RepID=UPI00027C64FE|nr:tape measure protein [Capnocytophaga sp. CM59]EJU32247.1 tape measure domain protein [Capnocytophaga sp. CM59]